MTRIRLPHLLPALLLAACGSDQEFGKVDDAYGAQGPMIQVEPPLLDFGALGDGEVATQTFTVSNIGPEESVLDVSDIRIGGADGGYSILSETEFSLFGGAPGREVEVAFTPEGANEQTAEAIVDSNDAEQPHVTVDLVGQGLVPELQIEPDPLDMGTTYVGCDKDNELTLTNVGTDTLIISSIEQRGAEFVFTNLNSLPLELEPGEDATLQLLFVPPREGDFSSEVVVESNEPIGTRVATQSGTGEYAGEYTDDWEVPTDPPSDIVFAVDQSCSMDDDQRALADNFSTFISTLSTYTTDWRIMVVNDDDGCNNSGVLTNSTSNYESRFSTAVSAGGGMWTEALLTVTSDAIDKTDSGDCNQNFLRPDAMLHIIMVSDEPEQSFRSWEFYVDAVIAKKGDASKVKFSAIAGPYPTGCNDRNNSAEYGSGYYEAVNYTGGEYLSICDDFGASVEALADASITMSTFTLSHTPAPETIVVSVNGTPTSAGWNYDSATNSIVFDPAFVPVEGDAVEATYSAIANCD